MTLSCSACNRVLRVMLHTRWSAEAWSQVRGEFRSALACGVRSDAGAVQIDPRLTNDRGWRAISM